MHKMVVMAALVFGCSGDDGNSSTDVSTEQLNGSCPTPPSILTGTKANGQVCTFSSECMPSCCSCTAGTNRYLAVACIDGVCTSPCSYTEQTASLCP